MEINYKLPKKEILRGFRAFKKVLGSSKYYDRNNVRVFYRVDFNYSSQDIERNKKPPINFIRVGIYVPKRKINKSSKRNRLKRLLKESYRLNKNILSELYNEKFRIALIFSLTEIGFERFSNTKNFKLQNLLDDVQFLLHKIKKNINKEIVG